MTTKTVLICAGAYLGLGLATAGYTVYLSANGKPHFEGTSHANAVEGLLQTVFLWPYAMYVNVKG